MRDTEKSSLTAQSQPFGSTTHATCVPVVMRRKKCSVGPPRTQGHALPRCLSSAAVGQHSLREGKTDEPQFYFCVVMFHKEFRSSETA
ncbi:hypothetical protein NQZ68_003041 [Dissostichus eleginoides]|nr:hypothetical protein NQZ68_003041 [Dissostichus eleginoides]